MSNMTPRERALRSLNHKEPDRVPIDVGGSHDSTFLEESYQGIQNFLKTNDRGKTANPWLGSIFPGEETYKKLGTDFRPVFLPVPEYKITTHSNGNLSFYDEWGICWTKRPNSYYFDVINFTQIESITDVNNYSWPKLKVHSSEWRLKIEDLGYQADKIKESGYASILDFGVAPMTMTQLILGFEKSCIYLLQQPKIIEAIMDKVLNVYMEQGLSIFESLGHRVDAIYAFADDLGTQHSLWLSPDHYRQIVKPYHRKIVDFIRKYSTAKIIFHSCGAIFDFIPDLIEIGIDALNPVQTSADGMEPTRLKSEYGKDLIFWGGIDTQHILPHGSPEDVRTEVRRKIDILSKNGGYVLAPVHNIQPDVPGENVWAMVDEARRYRT